MFDTKDFSSRLSQLRVAKGVSAREMSLALGQNSGYIQNIESGKALPSMQVFLYICEYLQITPSEFFDLENKTPSRRQALLTKLERLNDRQSALIESIIDEFLRK